MSTIVVTTPRGPSLVLTADTPRAAVLDAVQHSTGIPREALRLEGAAPVLRAALRGGLRGGKGGFGTLLRTMGRARGARQTTDFGACRDLHGRRLRHVNAEIAQARSGQDGQGGQQAGDTPTGIQGWFLGVPVWAEGFKHGKLAAGNSFMAKARKTQLCTDWLAARQNNPGGHRGRPRHWGCPRGRQCTFAHGEEDMQEDVRMAVAEERREAERARRRQAQEAYASVGEAAGAMADAVRAGLSKRKRGADEGAGEAAVAAMAPVAADGSAVTEPAELPCLLPSAGVVGVGLTAELEGVSEFGTAAVFGVALAQGRWYFEATLLTAGLIQIGVGNGDFRGDADACDGVGDDALSWAFDGARQQRWHDGEAAAYGREWREGDVVGCTLDASARTLSFSLNGEDLGQAFAGLTGALFFPAVSLERGQSVRLNLGQRPFLHSPGGDVQGVFAAVSGSGGGSSAAGGGSSAAAGGSSAASGSSAAAGASAEPESEPHPEPQPEPQPKKAKPEPEPEPLDLADFESEEQLRALGLERLKSALVAKGLKCGGTLEMRAARLFSVKGKSDAEIDPRIRAKAPKKKKARH